MNFSCTRILPQILILSSRGEVYSDSETRSLEYTIQLAAAAAAATTFVFGGVYSLAQGFSSLSDLAEHLVSAVDIVFPVIHGRFGEDGGIQVPFFVFANFGCPT